MISISTTKSNNISEAITGLSITNKSIQKALHQSIHRSVLRTKNRLAKDIASELKIPLKVVRRRLLMYRQKTPSSQEINIWCGLNDIPLQYLGAIKKVGSDILVRGVRADNAYISNNSVILRDSGKTAKLDIDNKVSMIISQRLPYYFDSEFIKNFEQNLRRIKQ